MTSIFIDWTEAEGFENETQSILRQVLEDEEHPRFKEVTKRLEVLQDGKLVDWWEESLDSYAPMMNYAHILETKPEEDKILDVALKTNCSIMFDNEKDVYYIALNGGGMDLSQDIGLAYVILENWIPEDLINQISRQEGLSISKEDFKTLKKEIVKQSQTYSERYKTLSERWKE
jgi:hypothetical protein